MRKLKRNELMNVDGGKSSNSALLNSVTNAVKVVLDLGRSLGSSIRRIGSNNLCPVR